MKRHHPRFMNNNIVRTLLLCLVTLVAGCGGGGGGGAPASPPAPTTPTFKDWGTASLIEADDTGSAAFPLAARRRPRSMSMSWAGWSTRCRCDG